MNGRGIATCPARRIVDTRAFRVVAFTALGYANQLFPFIHRPRLFTVGGRYIMTNSDGKEISASFEED